MTTAHLHPEERPYCSYGNCVELAEWHIRLEDGFESMDCTEHFRIYLGPDQRTLDFHNLGDACGIPEAKWHNSTVVIGDGYCAIDWGGGLPELIDGNRLVSA